MARLDGRSILIVEDEIIVAMVLADMLMDMGAGQVECARNVAGALELISARQFDVGIVDFSLDGEWSTEVTTLLREKSVPVIFATGYDRGLEPGAIVLRKPYMQSDLAHALEKALE